MSKQRFQIVWRGIAIAISYVPSWPEASENDTDAPYRSAHLEIETVDPARSPLPITETGYRSHYLLPGIVEEAGGPVTYVEAWLKHAARDRAWQTWQEEARQMTLF